VRREALHAFVLGTQQVPIPFTQATTSDGGHEQFGSPDEQATPLELLEDDEELEDEELGLPEDEHIKYVGLHVLPPMIQQVAFPLTHRGSRAIKVQDGVPPFAHNIQPLELEEVLPEEELEDEVVEEPLLDEDEELEEELEEGPQVMD